ncbi:MAG: phosphate ABC transporter permease PstA [Methanoregula sp.]|nr:phosphate ABC transporter permease PstA [Methanoregula sp.]
MNFRRAEEKIFLILSGLAALFAVSMLFYIVITIAVQAIPSLTWYFITTPESKTPGIGQGIANAIVGTIFISLFATILATPFAMGTAIYLSRYAPKNRLVAMFRFLLEVLSGTPSIVLGIFALLVFVYYLKPFSGGYSLIAGSIALAILILPVIERSIETSINAIDKELEEQSYALGATKWQTIRLVTLPCAIAGIVTGLILGFGRAAEESAVVILTAGYSQYMPTFGIKPNDNFFLGIKIYPFNDLVGTLPYSVYHAYENQSMIPLSNGFAAAFILIAFVLCMNISAKIILSYSFSGKGRRTGGSKPFGEWVKKCINPFQKDSNKCGNSGINNELPENPGLSLSGKAAQIIEKFPKLLRNPGIAPAIQETVHSIEDPVPTKKSGGIKSKAKTLLRSLLPFTIPAALLLLIAFLATIPPLHHILGKASPSLASFFGAGLAILVAAAGLVFGLLVARKGGAFRGKTRRIGYAGVAAGICLLCIAGIVCASAASGLFNTGDQPGMSATVDKKAQLAALMAQIAEEEAASAQASGPNGADQSSGNSGTVAAGGNSSDVTVPMKDALSLGERYQYGDSRHRVRATVYDYKILPYYFWWFIDYNRFVQSTPASGNSYLVVFIRVENTGDQSIVIPTADAFTVGYNGNTYTRLPYLNKSVISELQAKALSSENQREQYYQWIRELGATKRDYAYLTGQTYYENSWLTNSTVNTTSSSSNTTSGNSTAYSWYYLKPGASQAVDGYLIYEVPDEIATNLRATYVNGGFNQISGTRWSLG